MSVDVSTAIRDAIVAGIEATVGASPVLKVYTGDKPQFITSPEAGTLLVSMNLPADWMGGVSGGEISKAGTWQGTATVAGTAGHWRLFSSGGDLHFQGTLTAPADGGSLTIDTLVINEGQTVLVSSFSIAAGNA